MSGQPFSNRAWEGIRGSGASSAASREVGGVGSGGGGGALSNGDNYGALGNLGILVCNREADPPFVDQPQYTKLCRLGEKVGILVFVFSPENIDKANRRIVGQWMPPGGSHWAPAAFPLDSLVYDRFFAEDRRGAELHRWAVREFAQGGRLRWLGGTIGNKWSVYRSLGRVPGMEPYLPPTGLLSDPRVALHWLDREPAVFIKPLAGTQGRNTYRLWRTDEGGLAAAGRDSRNGIVRLRFDGETAMLRWIARLTERRGYLIQPFLRLYTREARAPETAQAFDVRALVQKDGRGRWRLTGFAARQGQPGSLTSNLHGGGRAVAARPFLARHYGVEASASLVETMERLSAEIPPILESRYGRLVELGIDFGIDRGGRIWILEVNSKPGRSAFTRAADREARNRAIYNPLLYARYLLSAVNRDGNARKTANVQAFH
jgi:glutathione synthase/RimK-type ligase-like ATP-grasp enzyme